MSEKIIKAKRIPEFTYYAVTKNGRVFSMSRIDLHRNERKGKWLKPSDCGNGHLCVTLSVNGKKHKKYVHRLVLETYVGKCPKNMNCCHNDGDPANNNLSNLRWDTQKSNIRDAINHGVHKHYQPGEEHPSAKLTEEQVILIFNAWHDGAYEERELAEYFNLNRATVNDIIHKRSWKCLWNKLDVTT